MYKHGHLGLNALIAAGFIVSTQRLGLDPAASLVGAVIIVAVARLPDRDAHFDAGLDYFYGNRLTYAVPIRHRGRVHSIGFAAVVAGVCVGGAWGVATVVGGVSRPWLWVVGVAGFVGICGHLLGDLITKQPIPVLWPLRSGGYAAGMVRSKHTLLNRGLFGLGGLVLLGALVLTLGPDQIPGSAAPAAVLGWIAFAPRESGLDS